MGFLSELGKNHEGHGGHKVDNFSYQLSAISSQLSGSVSGLRTQVPIQTTLKGFNTNSPGQIPRQRVQQKPQRARSTQRINITCPACSLKLKRKREAMNLMRALGHYEGVLSILEKTTKDTEGTKVAEFQLSAFRLQSQSSLVHHSGHGESLTAKARKTQSDKVSAIRIQDFKDSPERV